MDSQLFIVETFVNDSGKKRLLYVTALGEVCKKVPEVVKDSITIDLEQDMSPFKPFLSILADYKPSAELVHKYSYSVQENLWQATSRTVMQKSDTIFQSPMKPSMRQTVLLTQ